MEQVGFQTKFPNRREKGIKLLPVLFIWSFVFVALFTFLILNNEDLNLMERPYLLPWTLLTGAVIVAPGVYLWSKNQFTLFHPLVFAAWSYFFPAFFLGGLILVFGLSEPYFLAFVQDQKYNLPFTLVLVMIGFIGLTVGYYLPYGYRIGNRIGRFLPKMEWNTEHLWFPGTFLLIVGLINTIFGYIFGVLGYQKLQEIGRYDGLIFLLTLVWLEASFLLWMVLFKRRKFDLLAGLVGTLLIITALGKALFAGNRGGLLQIFILISLAYILAGRKVKFKQGVILSVTLFSVITIGMIYGTTFRNVKGSEARVDMIEYSGYIFDTFTTLENRDNLDMLEQGFFSLAERLDAVSSLAVVVSNYEQLKPYEEGYGLDNNIYKDTMTFLVPRIIWKDKPVASEPRLYSELYFNYGENSFTITPMGDLLRNFGLIGVPLGMIFLGFFIRIIYAVLVENQVFSYWRTTLFYMLLTAVSYESFFGSIIPYLFKVGVISVGGILIIHFLINKSNSSKV